METSEMNRTLKTAMTGALALSAAACIDLGTNPRGSLAASDFALALAGTGETQSSFSDAAAGGLTGFVSGGFHQQGPGGGGGGGRRGGGSWLMGGGLEGGFAGYGLGNNFGLRPIDNTNCTYNTTSLRLECTPVVRNGVTITRSFAFANASGVAQSAFDSASTDRINTRSTIIGSIVGGFRRGFGHGFRSGFGPGSDTSATRRLPLQNDTTTVNLASDRSVSGLRGTERLVNGTSGGTETTVGTDSVGRVTIVRVAGDTATGVRIPKTATGGMPYPIAGTIVRSMKVTLTYDGAAAQTSTRREVLTFDGSATATVTITQDGTIRNCTLPLPRGRLSCS